MCQHTGRLLLIMSDKQLRLTHSLHLYSFIHYQGGRHFLLPLRISKGVSTDFPIV